MKTFLYSFFVLLYLRLSLTKTGFLNLNSFDMLDCKFFLVAVLCFIGCLIASLPSRYWMPVIPPQPPPTPSHGGANQKCLQTSSNVSWGQNCSQWKTIKKYIQPEDSFQKLCQLILLCFGNIINLILIYLYLCSILGFAFIIFKLNFIFQISKTSTWFKS